MYMSFDVAKKAIDDFFCKLEKSKVGVIDFIGGEPLLAIDLLSRVTEYVVKNYSARLYGFSLTTNGTVLTNNAKVKEWISTNKEKLAISVSIDGDKETHDKNRCMSYDKAISALTYLIDIGMRDDVSIKMTIGPNSIGSVFKGICELHKFGVKIFSNVVFENVWGDTKEKAKLVAIFSQELSKLINFYLKHPELPHNSLVSLPIKLLSLEKSKIRKWCGSGETMKAIDINGKEYPCHRSITEGIGIKNLPDSHESDNKIIANNKCISCVFTNACPHCEVLDLRENGNMLNRTNHHCEFIKAQFIATAQLAYCKLKTKLDSSKLMVEELRLLRAVLFINDHLGFLRS
jgi:uncharacterized protein